VLCTVEICSEVTRRFPSLKLLDGIPVAQAIQFDVQAADLEATAKLARLPARVKGNFFDQESSQMAANDFLARYGESRDFATIRSFVLMFVLSPIDFSRRSMLIVLPFLTSMMILHCSPFRSASVSTPSTAVKEPMPTIVEQMIGEI
jgi:hypothetical protein